MAKPYPTNIIAEKILKSKLIGKYIRNYGYLVGCTAKEISTRNWSHLFIIVTSAYSCTIYHRHQEITMYGYIRDYKLSLVLLTTAPSYLITTTYI